MNHKQKINLIFEVLLVCLIFLFFLITLTPGNFGEIISAETWKSWSASRILLSEGRFIQNSLGPLYYSFITILTPLTYKQSIIVEYFFTHLFFLVSVYFLCRKYDHKILGILFSIFLITYIAFIESPKYLLATGFLIFHFIYYEKKYFTYWFPPFLTISLLINWGYIVFFLGHLIGKFYTHFKEKNFKLVKPNILTTILCMFLLCPWFLKADKFYNNHYVDHYNPKYSPVSLNSPLEVGFFQIGNWRYSKTKFEESDLYKADWYITHEKYYGECRSLICVLVNKPNIILNEVLNDPGYNLRMITSLLFNKDILIIKKKNFLFFFTIFSLIVIFGLFKILKKNTKNYILISCIFFGSLGYLLALSLTNFSYRYSFPFFSVLIFLLMQLNVKINLMKKKININYFLIIIVLTQLTFNIEDYYVNYKNKQFYQIKSHKEQNTKKVNYFLSESSVFELINEDQKILTTDSNWLSGFSKADPKKVYSLFSLPPIKDDNIHDFLDSFDIILLNYDINIPEASVGTQLFLRYELHLKDYINDNKKNWENKQIDNYGNAFIKKNL